LRMMTEKIQIFGFFVCLQKILLSIIRLISICLFIIF